MDACDPRIDIKNLKKLVKQNTGAELNLTREQICNAYSAIQEDKLPLPPLVLSKDGMYMTDRKSPLSTKDFETLFSSSSTSSQLKRVARKVGLSKFDKMTKDDIIESIEGILKSKKIHEPIKLHARPPTRSTRRVSVNTNNNYPNNLNVNNVNNNGVRNNNNNGVRNNNNNENKTLSNISRESQSLGNVNRNRNENKNGNGNRNQNRNRNGNGNRNTEPRKTGSYYEAAVRERARENNATRRGRENNRFKTLVGALGRNRRPNANNRLAQMVKRAGPATKSAEELKRETIEKLVQFQAKRAKGLNSDPAVKVEFLKESAKHIQRVKDGNIYNSQAMANISRNFDRYEQKALARKGNAEGQIKTIKESYVNSLNNKTIKERASSILNSRGVSGLKNLKQLKELDEKLRGLSENKKKQYLNGFKTKSFNNIQSIINNINATQTNNGTQNNNVKPSNANRNNGTQNRNVNNNANTNNGTQNNNNNQTLMSNMQKQINSANAQITAKNQEINQIKENMAAAGSLSMAQKEKLRQNLEKAQTERESFRFNAANARRELENLKQKRNVNLKNMNVMREQLGNLKVNRNELAAEAQRRQNALKDAAKKEAEITQKLGESTASINKLTTQRDELVEKGKLNAAEKAELERIRKELTNKQAEKNNEIKRLQALSNQREEALEEISKNLNVATRKLDNSMQRINNQEKSIAAKNKNLKETQNQVGKLYEEKKGFEELIASLKKQATETNEQIKQQTENLATSASEINRLQKQLTTATEARARNIENMQMRHAENIGAATAQIKELTKKVEERNAIIQRSKVVGKWQGTAVRGLGTQLRNTRTNLNKAKKEIGVARGVVTGLQRQRQNLQGQRNTLSGKLAQVRGQRQNLRRRNAVSQNVITGLTQQRQNLQGQRNTLSGKLAQVRGQRQNLRAQRKNLQSAMTGNQTALLDARSQIGKLQSERNATRGQLNLTRGQLRQTQQNVGGLKNIKYRQNVYALVNIKNINGKHVIKGGFIPGSERRKLKDKIMNPKTTINQLRQIEIGIRNRKYGANIVAKEKRNVNEGGNGRFNFIARDRAPPRPNTLGAQTQL